MRGLKTRLDILSWTNNCKKFWEDLSLQRSLLSLMYFIVGNIFQKIREICTYGEHIGTLNKKKLPLFEKFFMTLEFWKQRMLSFKGIRFCSMLGSNHKKVFGKLIERARGSFHFEELKLYWKWSSSQSFSFKFSESFQKRSDCRIYHGTITRTGITCKKIPF